VTACDDCLRRSDLIAAIAGRLQVEFKQCTAPVRVLAAIAGRLPRVRS
jgi:DNA processing protein